MPDASATEMLTRDRAPTRQAGEIVRTPLGLSAAVLGVRCAGGARAPLLACCTRSRSARTPHSHPHLLRLPLEATAEHDQSPACAPTARRLAEAGVADSARVWVRYETGAEAPLEPKQAAGSLSSLGCVAADCTAAHTRWLARTAARRCRLRLQLFAGCAVQAGAPACTPTPL